MTAASGQEIAEARGILGNLLPKRGQFRGRGRTLADYLASKDITELWGVLWKELRQ